MKQLLIIISVFSLISCRQSVVKDQIPAAEKSDQIYQYSVFTALANKIYDGSITVSDVKENGDLGLGTFNGLDGEMIVLDGNVFQLLSDGTILQPENSKLVPFTVVTFFDSDYSFSWADLTNYEELKTHILENIPTKNAGFAFKIQGKFDWIKCGGATKQEKPYAKTLSDALIDRPVFNAENLSGTMVGFWFPEYIGKTNVVGFHLHFISEDMKTAGHVIDFQSSDLSVLIDQSSGFNIELPDTKEFFNTDFDINQEYSNPSNK